MKTIAVANQKGGVGKTTTAVNLAAGLAVAGYDVALVDCDPQAHASTFVYDREKLDITLTDVICTRWDYSQPGRPVKLPFEDIRSAVYQTAFERLDVVPSNLGLASFDRDTAQAIDRLEEALREISEHYDFLILDCPPNLGLLFTAALKAAEFIIVPIAAQFLPLEGVGDLLQSLDEMIARRKLSILGALITLFDGRTSLSKSALESVRAEPTIGSKLFETMITVNTKLAEAPAFHVPIYAYQPQTAGSTRAIQQFDELTAEVLSRLQLPTTKKGEGNRFKVAK
ncbi:MAG TPA: ParA family protein [Pyrinomonadaceae bacterium]|jgi:chromosome partitioning protein